LLETTTLTVVTANDLDSSQDNNALNRGVSRKRKLSMILRDKQDFPGNERVKKSFS
jgi:hypothetical protein